MASLAQGLSSPELAGFLAGFQGAIKENQGKHSQNKEMGDEKFVQLMAQKLNIQLDEAKQIMNNSNATKDKPNTLNNESKNEVSQTKINEIKKKSEIAIKNQKKSKDKTKERSNQNPSLGKNL